VSAQGRYKRPMPDDEPRRTPRGDATHELIAEAAFRLISDASPDDFLGFLGPKRLADQAERIVFDDRRVGIRPPAPGTVGTHFAREGSHHAFDRGRLAGELVRRASADIAAAADAGQEGYFEAIDRFAATGDFDALVEAVAGDVDHYRPGGADPLTDARERLYFVATALADAESSFATPLRETQRDSVAKAAVIYRRVLEVTGRRMVDGYDETELATLIAMLMEGESLRHRSGASIAVEKVADAIFRIFWALTADADDPDPDYKADLTRHLPRAGPDVTPSPA
jgi:hypothetical protein